MYKQRETLWNLKGVKSKVKCKSYKNMRLTTTKSNLILRYEHYKLIVVRTLPEF